MKTKKLACQGCGADIDPVPGQKYIDCEYCGTTNVLESDTVHLPPGGAPPQAPPYGARVPPMQIRLPSGPSAKEVKKAGKIIALVVLSVVISFVGIGAVVFIQVFRGVSDAQKQHKEAVQNAQKTHNEVSQDAKKKMREAKRILNERLSRMKNRTGAAVARMHRRKKRPFRIESDNPLTADANDDGIADALVRGSGKVVAAIDGTTAEVIWKGTFSGGRSRKLFVVGDLVLVSHGEHLSAFALKGGNKRWSTKLDDRVYQVALRKTGLAIETQDNERLTLDPATGNKRGGRTPPFHTLSAGDGRKWLSNLGRGHRLTGAHKRKRRAQVHYCESGFVLRGKTVRRRRGPFVTSTTAYGCKAKRALLYATDKRRREAFLIGLQKGRGKIWETRLWGRAQRFGGNPAIAIRGDVAAVAYAGRSAAGVVLLSMTTGAKKWSHPLPARTRVRGIALSPGRVFLRTGSWLELLDTKTGKPPVTSATSGSALPTPSGLPTP